MQPRPDKAARAEPSDSGKIGAAAREGSTEWLIVGQERREETCGLKPEQQRPSNQTQAPNRRLCKGGQA